MNTVVVLMSVLDLRKVLHQTKLVQGCLHRTLSVPLHLLPTIQTKNIQQKNH